MSYTPIDSLFNSPPQVISRYLRISYSLAAEGRLLLQHTTIYFTENGRLFSIFIFLLDRIRNGSLSTSHFRNRVFDHPPIFGRILYIIYITFLYKTNRTKTRSLSKAFHIENGVHFVRRNNRCQQSISVFVALGYSEALGYLRREIQLLSS